MAALRVGRRSLEKRYAERAKALLGMASDVPDRPSPDDIHNLRVAARRIQMTRRLVPRINRSSPDSKRFDLALRSVLKATSQLRDMDTLMDTLESHRGVLPPALLVNLENQRSDAAARAKAVIGVLADVPAPELGASKVRKKGLSKRLRKRVRKHSTAASALMADVLNDESKLEELHSLRKEVKKIRYLVELAKKTPARLQALVKWQESLGAIHDLDVAISYLERADVDSKRRAILELQRARHSRYLKLIRSRRSELARALGEEGAPPLNMPQSLGINPAEG
jgi:CHAD domain-containing protein